MKVTVTNKSIIWLAVLLVAAAFLLRFAQLSSNPAGFFRDEADKGYTTYCLLQTGQDQAGRTWPLFVKAMIVTTSAMYQYLDMPFVALLGLSETAVRLPACLAGTLSVVVAFLLARSLWGASAGLWAGLFVCLSPWSLLLSRWANQSILLTVSIPLGVFFFARQRDRSFPSIGHALLSAMCFIAALYTYEPAQMYVPVFVVLIWLVSLPRKSQGHESWKAFFFSAMAFFVLFAVGCLPLARHLLVDPVESGARLSRITINQGQPFLALLGEWFKNYALHFSPGFLFIHGDENLRHSAALFGQLHLYLLPPLVIGIARALRGRTRVDRILLIWLFCFPIAAAYTRERVPHALRSVFAVPVFQVMAVYGVVSWNEWRTRLEERLSTHTVKTLARIWLAALAILPGLYLYNLYFRYPVYSAIEWEYGYRQAVDWWKANRQRADSALVSGQAEYPYVFFLFYDRYPPEKWIREQRIEGVEFVPTGQSTQSARDAGEGRVLYLLRQEEMVMAQPEIAIQLPTGEVIWKWIAWGKKRE